MESRHKVLIIMPTLNEGRVIKRLVKEVRKHYPQYAIVVINDGSTDNTSIEAKDSGAMVIDLPYNLGIGGAMQCGFKLAAEGDFDAAIQIDGDGQHNPQSISSVLEPVLAGKFDLCIGSRFLSVRSGFKSTFTRRIGITFFSYLLRILTGSQITDPTSGYRAYSKNIIRRFATDYPIDFPEPEAIIMAKLYGSKIGEVPVNMRKRLGGISSIRYLKTLYYMMKVTLAILIDTLKKRS